MNLNYKENLKRESNSVLFKLFSERKRINVEPQLYAGNLLFERNYRLEELKSSKEDLLIEIEEAFNRKFDTNPQKLIRENTVKEILLMLMSAIVILGPNTLINKIIYQQVMGVSTVYIPYIMAVACFIPLFWLKKRNQKAVKKMERKKVEKNLLLTKIKTELKF